MDWSSGIGVYDPASAEVLQRFTGLSGFDSLLQRFQGLGSSGVISLQSILVYLTCSPKHLNSKSLATGFAFLWATNARTLKPWKSCKADPKTYHMKSNLQSTSQSLTANPAPKPENPQPLPIYVILKPESQSLLRFLGPTETPAWCLV